LDEGHLYPHQLFQGTRTTPQTASSIPAQGTRIPGSEPNIHHRRGRIRIAGTTAEALE
jgi:hypothetical protein